MTKYCTDKEWEERYEDVREYSVAHVDAMTKENLHSKARIAYELGKRDKRIEELEARNAKLTMALDGLHGTPCEQIRHEQEVERLKALNAELVEALKVSLTMLRGAGVQARFLEHLEITFAKARGGRDEQD